MKMSQKCAVDCSVASVEFE